MRKREEKENDILYIEFVSQFAFFNILFAVLSTYKEMGSITNGLHAIVAFKLA